MKEIINLLNNNITFLTVLLVLSLLHIFSNLNFVLFFFWVCLFMVSFIGTIRYLILNKEKKK